MGTLADTTYYHYDDNRSMLINSSQLFSVLNNKSNSIAFHMVRDGTGRDK